MRAVVTGGAGFIGSALVDRLLAEGHAVEVVDNLSSGSLGHLKEARAAGGEFRFHQLDVRAPELSDLLIRRRPDVVFHLAGSTSVASSFGDPIADAEACVLAGVGVLEAARLAGAHKVVLGVSANALLHGASADDEPPYSERHLTQPGSPHGVATKAVLDYLALYRERHGLEYSALALATVYGPRQLESECDGAAASFARDLAAGRTCELHGGGAQTRDFVFVDDVVDAFSRASGRGSGLLMNVGTGVATSIASLHATMAARCGADPGVATGPRRAGDLSAVALDAGRAGIHLGWRPWTALEDGVALMLTAASASGGGARRAVAH